jgi:hypothetical protein
MEKGQQRVFFFCDIKEKTEKKMEMNRIHRPKGDGEFSMLHTTPIE